MKKGIDAVTEEMRFVAYYDYDFHRVFKRLSQFVNNFPYNSYNIEKAIEFIKEMDFRYEYDPKRYPLKEKFYFSFFSFLIFALLVDSILMKENNKEIQ
ncbi:MAG: hypothetical protein DRP84_01445 [Spirochaetes bacterium]|nr:MAG: hypothetical protein DRP84_01445 [Spirochaetota bacterium]